eukprot:gene7754-7953_t
MDGKAFVKMCKDCKLMSKGLTTTDVDLIFTKVKAKGARKITFNGFLKAIDDVAAKKGCSLDEVVAAVINAGGPVDNGTKAEAVKWHDDKSLYTGVYAQGGPTNVDMDPTNLAGLCNRAAADVRGVNVKCSPAGSRRTTGEVTKAGSAAAARRTTGEATAGLKNMKI